MHRPLRLTSCRNHSSTHRIWPKSIRPIHRNRQWRHSPPQHTRIHTVHWMCLGQRQRCRRPLKLPSIRNVVISHRLRNPNHYFRHNTKRSAMKTNISVKCGDSTIISTPANTTNFMLMLMNWALTCSFGLVFSLAPMVLVYMCNMCGILRTIHKCKKQAPTFVFNISVESNIEIHGNTKQKIRSPTFNLQPAKVLWFYRLFFKTVGILILFDLFFFYWKLKCST